VVTRLSVAQNRRWAGTVARYSRSGAPPNDYLFPAREAPIAMRLIEDSPTRLVLRKSVWLDITNALVALLFSLLLIAVAVLLVVNPFRWHLSEPDYRQGQVQPSYNRLHRKPPAVVVTITGYFFAILGAGCLAGAISRSRAVQTRDYRFDAATGTFSVHDRPLFLPARDAGYPFSAIAQINVEGRDKSWWVRIQLAGVGPIVLDGPLLKWVVWAVDKDAATINAPFPHGYVLMPSRDQERAEQFAGRLRQMVGQPNARPAP
jgi:hypothetical protein